MARRRKRKRNFSISGWGVIGLVVGGGIAAYIIFKKVLGGVQIIPAGKTQQERVYHTTAAALSEWASMLGGKKE